MSQTEWVSLPTASDAAQAVTSGTTARQWMSQQGVVIAEAGSSVTAAVSQPVVFTAT